MANYNVSVLFRAINQISGPAAKIQTSLAGVAGGAAAASKGLMIASQAMGALAAKMTAASAAMKSQLAGGLGMVGAVAGIGKIASSWEGGIRKIATMLPGGLKEAQRDVEPILRQIAKTTGVDLATIAEAGYQAFSSNVSKADFAKVLDVAAKASIAGFTDVKTAMDGITTVMNTYGMEASRVADIMLNTQNMGKTTFGELSKDMGQAISIANAMGVSFEEMMANIAALTQTGLGTGQAMTAIRSALASAMGPSSKAVKVFQQIGFKFDIAAVKTYGMVGAMNMLVSKIKTTYKTEAEQMKALDDTIGRIEGMNNVLKMDTVKAMNVFNASLKGNRTQVGQNEAAYKIMAGGAGHQFKVLKNEMMLLAIDIGKVLIPTIRSLMSTVSTYIKPAAEWIQSNKDTVEVIGKVVVALGLLKIAIGVIGWLMGPVVWILRIFGVTAYFAAAGSKILAGGMWLLAAATKGVSIAMAFLAANPIVLVILAVVALGAAIYMLVKHWDKVKSALASGFNWLAGKIKWALNKLGLVAGITQSLSDETGVVTAGQDMTRSLSDVAMLNAGPAAAAAAASNTSNVSNNQNNVFNIQVDGSKDPSATLEAFKKSLPGILKEHSRNENRRNY